MDGNGKPIKQAELRLRAFSTMPPVTKTDEDGHFRLADLLPEPITLIASAPGYGLQAITIDPAKTESAVLRLVPSAKLRLQVVDERGQPVEGVLVQGDDWRKTAVFLSFRTDAQGRTVWDQAPADTVEFMISKPGFAELFNLPLRASGKEEQIVLPHELLVRGMVRDGETGRLVNEFQWMPVCEFDEDTYATDRSHARPGADGRFEAKFRRVDFAHRIRVEAKGYRSAISQAFRVGEADTTCIINLQRCSSLTGRLLDAEGRGVSGARLVIATRTQPVAFFSKTTKDQCETRSVTDGSFEFPAQYEDYFIAAATDAGYAVHRGTAGDVSLTMQVQPWGQLTGTLSNLNGVVPRHPVALDMINDEREAEPPLRFHQRAETDSHGRFSFSRVLAGNYRLQGELSLWKDGPLRSSQSLPVQIRSGQSMEQSLGGDGATLRGAALIRGVRTFNYSHSMNYLVEAKESESGFPTALNTRESSQWLANRRHWFVKLDSDGSFAVDGIAPGKYRLLLQLFEPPEDGCLVCPVARYTEVIDVEHGDRTLPTISLTKLAGSRLGEEFPDISLINEDGEPVSLSAYRGQVLLVDLWASWCGACLKQAKVVREIAERYPDDPRFALLGVNLDDDMEQAQNVIRKRKMHPSQAFVKTLQRDDVFVACGCSTLPAYLVIDANGKLRYRGPSLQTADETVKSELKQSGKGE